MNYWERLIDVYESWDFDSLCDEAYELSCAVRDDIRRNWNVKDPLYAAIMVGAYFMDADGFADGAEVSLFRNLFEDQPIDLGVSEVNHSNNKAVNRFFGSQLVTYFKNIRKSFAYNLLVYGWYRIGRSSQVFLSTMLLWCENVSKPTLPWYAPIPLSPTPPKPI